jgi:uncharacterized membrane protein
VAFLDALRLVAAFQMIQGHTIDAMLDPSFRVGALFRAWTFARGLTSTAFLFTAGFAFAVVTCDAARAERGRLHRVRRGAQLVALGYLLHAPLSGLFGVPWSLALAQAQAVDILQCIGVSLWALELLGLVCKAPNARVMLSFGLCGGCFLATQASAHLLPEGVFAPLLHYFTARGGSLFPLVPWAGYAFAGYGLGVVVLARSSARPKRLPSDLGLAAALVLSLAGLAFWFAKDSDALAFLLLKLGLVAASSAALAAALGPQGRLPALLERLSGETLFLYVSHVLALYGAGIGLSTLVGRTLSPLAAGMAALLFVLVCSASALAYRRGVEALRGRKGRSRPALQRVGSRGET